MAFIVKSDGKLYGTYNSCYESIRVAQSLINQGHKVQRIATGQDKTNEPMVVNKQTVSVTSRKRISDWVERMNDLNLGHNSPKYYEKRKARNE